jgi:hypothetical protein
VPKVEWLHHIMRHDFKLAFRFEGSTTQEVTAWITIGQDPEIGPVVLRSPATDELGLVLGRAVNLIIAADEASLPTN